ncbi:unnamed protein product [Darwinula stevensoni]|uniref:Uncharacterized protein n=1 Tax=Darwinula stevensoni TaxID=69355 RepID=A0A7R9ABS6_9CRUS|nr:unnamed protein product [Darwinula stevensoni]CAG0899729.1 unnamed protein product [Darwinula stevensoni]
MNYENHPEASSYIRDLLMMNQGLQRILRKLTRPENTSHEKVADLLSVFYDMEDSEDWNDPPICVKPFAEMQDATMWMEDTDLFPLLLERSSYTLDDFRRDLHAADISPYVRKSIRRCSFNGSPCEETPDPIRKGFEVNIQTISYIGIRKMELEHLGPEDGGFCAPDAYLTQRFDPIIFKIPEVPKYSKEICLNMCCMDRLINNVSDSRSCLKKYIFYSSLLTSSTNAYDYCSTKSQADAVLWMLDTLKNENGSCGCPPRACREEKYEWSLSSAQVSRENVLLLDLIAWMREQKKSKSRRKLKDSTYCHHPKENFAVVNVYFESMETEKIVESLIYPWSTFVGTLGGLLGLYTGLSFISVLEVLEWFLDVILYGWRKPRHHKTGPKRPVDLTRQDTTAVEVEPKENALKHRGYNGRDSPVHSRSS